MDDYAIDRLARIVAGAATRRGMLAVMAGLPLAGFFVSLLTPRAEARRKSHRRRGHARQEHDHEHTHGQGKVKQQKRKKRHKKRCAPESAAKTCAGRCGTVPNNCDQPVDCGSCACGSACPVCQTCNTATGRCETNQAFIGQACGLREQFCQADGTCVCDATRCAVGQRCNGIVCVCDETSCPTGCCDDDKTCHIDDPAACGTGGGVCTVCPANNSCSGGQCACAGCLDGTICRPGNTRQACGGGGFPCETCSGACIPHEGCTFCSPSAGLVCSTGECCDLESRICAESCPDCKKCNSQLECEADPGQNRFTCQLPEGGGTGVCCNGACCPGCCDALIENGECGPCLAFVTGTTYTGDLGGLDGADAKCQARAEAGGFWGSYKAWLSSAFGSPSSRFRCTLGGCSTTGYKLVSPPNVLQLIANNWDTLTHQNLLLPINVTELGASRSPASVWTNTLPNGGLNGPGIYSCQNWTEETVGPLGNVGEISAEDTAWTSNTAVSCPNHLSLYCFQQS